MDATGLALVVIALAFLCWLLAPSRERAETDRDAPHSRDPSVATGSSPG